jgi:ketosteroid isomerase-like protein
MKKYFGIRPATHSFQTISLVLVAAALFLSSALPAAAQKEKKKKKDNTPPMDISNMPIPMPDEQQIDYILSEMLGAWQIGDVEKLHKDYADDVSIVNGSWAPPIIGWSNYLAVYQQQRARMQQVRMDRLNTYIKVSGTAAWACYQWDFAAVVDGEPTASQGHTTVVLEKRSNHWVIVHSHTSLASAPQPAKPPAKPSDTPAKPAAP